MDAQTANYFSRLIEDTGQLVASVQRFNNRVQEAYDRNYHVNLPTDEDFQATGDLDHLTGARLAQLLSVHAEMKAALEDNQRQGWNDLFEVIR